MVFGPSRLGLDETAQAGAVSRGRASTPAAPRTDLVTTAIPAIPPPEVLDALDTAARVLEELAAKRLNLHFEYDDRANQVRVQVTDEDGVVIREIPQSALLDIAAGTGMAHAA